jgi:hypothetical protein
MQNTRDLAQKHRDQNGDQFWLMQCSIQMRVEKDDIKMKKAHTDNCRVSLWCK